MADVPWLVLPALAAAGFLAAVVNTLAGGGSLLTLPLLVAVGLPAGVANGTNRLSVALQGLTSAWTFHRHGAIDHRTCARLAIPMGIGALAGAWAATRIDDRTLRVSFGWLLVAWGAILAFRPGRFLHPAGRPRPAGPAALAIAALVGGYGGFFQAGVGFPLLALLVSGLGHDAVRANAIKVLLVLAYTLAVIPVFAAHAQVAWGEGAALAAGSAVGGWVATRWQLRIGARLVRWAVVVAVAASGLAMALR